WRRFTGKPFVFAFWAIRDGAASDEDLARTVEVFGASRDEGLRHIPQIADEWTQRLALSRETINDYLLHNIHYHLDVENVEGLKLFFQLATSCGFLPPAPELRFARE